MTVPQGFEVGMEEGRDSGAVLQVESTVLDKRANVRSKGQGVELTLRPPDASD